MEIHFLVTLRTSLGTETRPFSWQSSKKSVSVFEWQSTLVFPIQTQCIGQRVQHHVAALWRNPRRLLTGRALCPVNLRPGLKQAESRREEKEVSSEGAVAEGVQEGVAARVDRVEENQKDFGFWDGDERELEGGWDCKEGDGSHADEVGEDEDSHALGHTGVGVGRRGRGVADGQVDAEVTAAHAEEGQDVEEKERHHIDLRHQRLHVHGQTDAHLHV